MGYRIDYQPIRKVRRREIYHARVAALTALCFLLFLVLVNTMWPEGAQVLKNALFSVRDAVAISAIEAFADNLGTGSVFWEAFRTFCQNITQGYSFGTG